MDNYNFIKNGVKEKGYKIKESANKRGKRLDIYKSDGSSVSITPSQLNKSQKKFLEMLKKFNLENVSEVQFSKEDNKYPVVKSKTKVIKPLEQKLSNVKPTLQNAKTVKPQKKNNMPVMPNILPFPSTGAKASNDIEDINAVDMPESNVNNGTPTIEPNPGREKNFVKVKVNEEDRKRQTNEPNINILNNITPASLSSPVVLPTTNLVSQQQSNIDANNTALAPSQQVQRQEASKQVETQKGLSTEDTSNLNNLNEGLKQDNALNIDNKDVLDEANMIIKNTSNKINDGENIDVDAKVLTLAEKEIQNGLESDKEAIENQLNKFLQTYDPNLIDYTSPDAIKQYTLLTTQLLRLLNDKVEFLPDIKKGVDQVNKVKAEINQGDNIVKQGKIEPELEKQKDQLDGIHERYVDYNGIKYLELNDYHPALVVGALKL